MEDELDRAFSMHGEKSNAYSFWDGEPEGKMPMGEQRHKSDDTTKMDLEGM
jgi:hypothetical protein